MVIAEVVGAVVGIPDTVRDTFSEETIQSMRKGGKAMFASFYCFIFLVWSLKAVLLGFYSRLTCAL
jgi:fluoride ion exporter CrcB/FEX